MKKLKTITQHNEERREFYMPTKPVYNGIACDECGSELIDSRPHVQKLSSIPQKDVHCSNCGWKGIVIS